MATFSSKEQETKEIHLHLLTFLYIIYFLKQQQPKLLNVNFFSIPVLELAGSNNHWLLT